MGADEYGNSNNTLYGMKTDEYAQELNYLQLLVIVFKYVATKSIQRSTHNI